MISSIIKYEFEKQQHTMHLLDISHFKFGSIRNLYMYRICTYINDSIYHIYI